MLLVAAVKLTETWRSSELFESLVTRMVGFGAPFRPLTPTAAALKALVAAFCASNKTGSFIIPGVTAASAAASAAAISLVCASAARE